MLSMKACDVRFSVFFAVGIFLFAISALPVISQDSKPDDVPTKSIQRAGVNGVGSPVCVYCPFPDYSQKARADKLEGMVLLDITVTLEGRPKTVVLVKGLGDGLDEKAIEAVKSWRFTLAKDSSGKPVATRVQVEVAFHLYK
jgi:TonB family protein